MLLPLDLPRGTGAPREGLVPEEVVTQEAPAQLGNEAEDVPHTVRHREVPQVQFSIKGSENWKTTGTATHSGLGQGVLCVCMSFDFW